MRAAFSHDGLLQWQILFYSEGRVVSRSTGSRDRYPPYVAAANALVRSRPAAVAEVGLLSDFDPADLAAGHVDAIAGVYGLVVDVDENHLRERGFAF